MADPEFLVFSSPRNDAELFDRTDAVSHGVTVCQEASASISLVSVVMFPFHGEYPASDTIPPRRVRLGSDKGKVIVGNLDSESMS
jgi:hypothetical protein